MIERKLNVSYVGFYCNYHFSLKKIVKNVKKLQYKVVYILIETGPNNYNILITFLIINYMIL